MYATRISEPAGAINEEEIRAHFFIGIQSPKKTTKGLSQCVALPFTLKSILRPQKNNNNNGNSNISPCKNIIFKKILSKKTKILQDIITL
jgi:hypothetical protein